MTGVSRSTARVEMNARVAGLVMAAMRLGLKMTPEPRLELVAVEKVDGGKEK